MSVKPDLTGQVFFRLTVVMKDPVAGKRVHWLCTCVCGNQKSVRTCYLIRGNVKSCGCYGRSGGPLRQLKHGLSETAEYMAWHNMIVRCHNPNHPSYPRYGARGITVYDRWRNSFEVFLTDVGTRPTAKHSLDRVDNERGYEPPRKDAMCCGVV